MTIRALASFVASGLGPEAVRTLTLDYDIA
jgi:hypothetical protein